MVIPFIPRAKATGELNKAPQNERRNGGWMSITDCRNIHCALPLEGF